MTERPLFGPSDDALHQTPLRADGEEVLDSHGNQVLAVNSDCVSSIAEDAEIARSVAYALNLAYDKER